MFRFVCCSFKYINNAFTRTDMMIDKCEKVATRKAEQTDIRYFRERASEKLKWKENQFETDH